MSASINMPVTHVPNPDAADGRGTSGGGNPPVLFVNDPNAEGLTPADPTLPCVAYSTSTANSMFVWNVSSQRWV